MIKKIKGKSEKLAAIAKKLRGRPYKYGAKPSEAPRYFDCSSFIQYLYGQIGHKLPRSTIEQAEYGKKINNIKNIRAGDLIFLHGIKGHYNKKFPMGIGHVVMVLDKNKVIHASSRRIKNSPKIVEKGKVKIEPFTKILKRKDIIVIKRIL
jgi:cell wall-associated NlpC family hydrolase